jgi:putative transposase
MMQTESLAAQVGVRPACAALNVSPATFYRHRQPATPAKARPAPPLALPAQERQEVLELLRSSRFVDLAPRQVWAQLLDEGRYICSVRTMYRYLEAEGETRERRDQLRRPNYRKPELLATAPNQVWSWDITKLKGPAKWTYFHLYVIIDIFSRYVVGWMLAHGESQTLAEKLIQETVEKHGIVPGQLTVHADRGPSMTSKLVAQLLGELGVTKTHSRPYTSNDNPYSEAQFKTLKYRPDFPNRFGSFQDAKTHIQAFIDWYNLEHCHTGLVLLTPKDVHYGQAKQILEQRAEVLQVAFEAHPERFKGRMPNPGKLPDAVWINPPIQTEEKLH